MRTFSMQISDFSTKLGILQSIENNRPNPFDSLFLMWIKALSIPLT